MNSKMFVILTMTCIHVIEDSEEFKIVGVML